MAEAAPVIDVRGLTKVFGHKTVVKGVDMQISRGEIFGFLGPNGSGKTTFIRMLCGLLKPDGGEGTCLGFDVRTESERIKPRVGYMAQRFSLYDDLTVRENLDFMARAYRLPRRKAAVAETIERFRLPAYAGQLAGSLSGGWKQRLALAACILHEPQLLLLDEPTAGVDPSARRDFWDQVHELAAGGITALISTHYMDEAERCHRLAYIAYGDLLARGTGAELIKASGLCTFAVSGPDLPELAARLKSTAGVDQVAAFGLTLHVSGRDCPALEAALGREASGRWRVWRIETSLEEVFIDLMHRSGKSA